MSIEFVLCRRRDDHSVTHEIARRSLRRWPDWEPVPDAETDEQAASGESPAEGAAVTDPVEEPASGDAKDSKTTTPSKARSRAATDK
jgi:hypothetical protein